jgi:hypothetical protein
MEESSREFSFLARGGRLAEITVKPVERLGVDAAILFADILLILEPMGLGLEYSKDDGPVIHGQIRSRADVEQLQEFEPEEALPFVMETVRRARAALGGKVPLIGFSGAPFTLASYIEGGSSRNYLKTKRLIYSDPAPGAPLRSRRGRKIFERAIAAGPEAVQISTAGPAPLARRLSNMSCPTRAAIAAVARAGDQPAPVRRACEECAPPAASSAIGGFSSTRAGKRSDTTSASGNLDPACCSQNREIRWRVQISPARAGGPGILIRYGVFRNPVDNAFMVETVHELSAR